MALGGNLVSTADNPGIFGWTVLAEFFEELFETGFELADGAVALEAQGNITGRRHVLVYVRIGQRASRRVSGEARRTGKRKGRPCRRPLARKSIYSCRYSKPAQDNCCCRSRRFCLISLILSSRSSACFWRVARSSMLSTMSALRR